MIMLALIAAGGGVLLLLCGACALVERYQRAHPKRKGYKFADSRHVLKDSERVHENWDTGEGWNWGEGGFDCDLGGGGGGVD